MSTRRWQGFTDVELDAVATAIIEDDGAQWFPLPGSIEDRLLTELLAEQKQRRAERATRKPLWHVEA